MKKKLGCKKASRGNNVIQLSIDLGRVLLKLVYNVQFPQVHGFRRLKVVCENQSSTACAKCSCELHVGTQECLPVSSQRKLSYKFCHFAFVLTS